MPTNTAPKIELTTARANVRGFVAHGQEAVRGTHGFDVCAVGRRTPGSTAGRIAGAIASAVATASLLLAPVPSAAADQQVLGVASCSSPVCHGGASASAGSRVLQNEYLVWVEQDPHARAYRTLLGERSQRIARNLGLDSAEGSDLCLPCHATNASPARRGERFSFEDGVGCESCHGASGGWIESHDDPDVSRAHNLSDGMIALDAPTDRAERCLGCHVSGEGSDISHRIMAAGHPRMAFELDAFTWLAPAHFRIDDDYRRRKRVDEPVVVWALGQIAAMNARMQRLADGRRSRDGNWPEFVMFECESCHHPMGDRAPGPGSELGFPRLDRSNWTMLRSLVEAVGEGGTAAGTKAANSAAARLVSRRARLVRAGVAFGDEQAGLAREEGEHLARLAERFDAWRPTDDELERLLARIVARENAEAYQSYSEAEQAVLAVQAVVATLSARGVLAEDAPLLAGLEGLFNATDDETSFSVAAFRRALGKVRTELK